MSYKVAHKNKATIILNEAQMIKDQMKCWIEVVYDDYSEIVEVLNEFKIEKENLAEIIFNRIYKF